MLAGCSRRGARAHYEQAQAFADQQLTADAMRAYQQAIEAGDDKDYVALATNKLGHLYMKQGDMQKASDCFDKSYALAEQLGDTVQMVMSRRDAGRLVRATGNVDAALACFAKADELINQAGADSLRGYVYPEYISLLMQEGQVDQVRQLIGRLSVDCTSGPSCLVMARAYEALGITDSARFYFRRTMETNHVEARASAAMFLAELASEQQDWAEAYELSMECAVLVDSAKHQMQQENGHLIASLANQLSVERENRRLQLTVALVVLVAIVVVAALLFYVRRRIEHMKRAQEERQRQRRHEARSQQEMLVEEFRNTSLYRRLLADESIDYEGWDKIASFLDEHADHFTEQLLRLYPKMKPQEMQVCQLLKLELTNQQIANLLCRTQQAITNLRKRLFQKMFDREGTAEELNRFLRLFPQVEKP